MALFSTNVKAITFEQYIVDHESESMHSYITGYADAIHNNAYFFGGCPRKFPYRPYGEYFQQIDIYIAHNTKDKQSQYADIFLQKPVEPFLTETILKYIDCNNPEALQLNRESKSIQIAMRELARDIMEKTERYQSPEEREMKFQYKEFLKKVNNPKKYEKKCPVCPKQKPCKISEATTVVPIPVVQSAVPVVPLPVIDAVNTVQEDVNPQTIEQNATNNVNQQIDVNIPVQKFPELKIIDAKPNDIKPNDVNNPINDTSNLQSQKYELDSLKVDLNNIDNVSIPKEL